MIVYLDRPLRCYTQFVDADWGEVRFLSKPIYNTHLIRVLEEKGIAYQFLSVPVNKWHQYDDKMFSSRREGKDEK